MRTGLKIGYIYSAGCVLSALFIWLYIGETRGRTLEGKHTHACSCLYYILTFIYRNQRNVREARPRSAMEELQM